MRVIALAALLFSLAVSASWAGANEASGSAALKKPPAHATTYWRATVAKLPANAATGKKRSVFIGSISCASPGNCGAVGSYLDKAGGQEGLLLTEKAGKWRRGVKAIVPADADADPGVDLRAVSCASAGNCTAVGTYSSSSAGIYDEGGMSVLLLAEKAGHWRAGVEAVLPADAGGATINLASLSCISAGNCAAVGSYESSYTYGGEGLLLTEKSGHWAPGVSYGRWAAIRSVSCSPDGSCTAVGYANAAFDCRDECPSADTVWLTNKRGGEWHEATDVPPGLFLRAVSCVSARNCSAFASDYSGSGIDQQGAPLSVLVTEKAGKWREVLPEAPKNANSPYWGDAVDLRGISCASRGNCGAIGTYYGRHYGMHVTLLTEHAGKWRRGVEAALPRGAKAPEAVAISCASRGNCTVVGHYNNRSGMHGFLLPEIAGSWTRRVTTPHPTTYLSDVSCVSRGSCGAVGGDSHGYGTLLDSSAKR